MFIGFKTKENRREKKSMASVTMENLTTTTTTAAVTATKTTTTTLWNSQDYLKYYDDIISSTWNHTNSNQTENFQNTIYMIENDGNNNNNQNQNIIVTGTSSSSSSSINSIDDIDINGNNNDDIITTTIIESSVNSFDDNGGSSSSSGGSSSSSSIIAIAEALNDDADYAATFSENNNFMNISDINAYGIDNNINQQSYDNLNEDGGGGGVGGIGGEGIGVVNGNGGDGSNFMLLLEDFGEYFYNYNGSGQIDSVLTGSSSSNGILDGYGGNLTYLDFNRTITNCSMNNTTCFSEDHHNYWALILILFPFLTLFGNVLVIISVCRERSLQTVTNYFIVSLALADLLVAVVVMPFAVYVLVNGAWSLPNFVCDFYIAMDVICSTSSIFNLVAISIDRYIAVTQPIKYAKHKNSRRVCLTILLVWAISAAIGSPIVLGLNNTPNRVPDLCVFYNSDFIVYSSLSSFYIPCIIMVFLYWNIFKALRIRARKQKAARKPNFSDIGTGGSVIENIAHTRRLAETTLDTHKAVGAGGLKILPDDQPTNTASGSNEEEDENAVSPDIDDCHVIVNDKSTEFMLATVVEETGNVVAQISTQPQLVVADPNGNHDSGYAPSNVDDVLAGTSTPPDSPVPSGSLKRSSLSRRDVGYSGSPKKEPLSVAMKPLSLVRYGVQGALALARNDSTVSTISKSSSRKDKKNSQASRFTIYKVHKASKKKREKSSAKKERKATKTLAIVLGVFLFCWVPFFTCNIMDAMCTKLGKDCQPGVTAFILTTWLGYMNSFVNPVIYTIFNPEFRKAFKKIMHLG